MTIVINDISDVDNYINVHASQYHQQNKTEKGYDTTIGFRIINSTLGQTVTGCQVSIKSL